MTVHEDGINANKSPSSDFETFLSSKATGVQSPLPLSSSVTESASTPSAKKTGPPPPPPLIGKASIPPPAPPSGKGSGPPPPPPGGGRVEKPKTRLKRSNEMGKLYRNLKYKIEGLPEGKTAPGGKGQVPPTNGGNKGQGVSDAMAEMTNRSSYFRQIEEDVVNHAATILKVKYTIESFKTKDKLELLKLSELVERSLEPLTDETLVHEARIRFFQSELQFIFCEIDLVFHIMYPCQYIHLTVYSFQVLSKFEDFPFKKLEALRLATGLYKKLDTVVATLNGWKLVSPIAQQLEKIENYFNKMRLEVDAIERSKDDDIKKFQNFKIEVDYTMLVKVKEAMVDLSSNCIEMALKESKEIKKMASNNKAKVNALPKMLWRVFVLSYQVYSFAGGQDERAEKLTAELAHEIESLEI